MTSSEYQERNAVTKPEPQMPPPAERPGYFSEKVFRRENFNPDHFWPIPHNGEVSDRQNPQYQAATATPP